MTKKLSVSIVAVLVFIALGISCSQPSTTAAGNSQENASTKMYGGTYDSELAWGKHLVQVGGCGDCHTPKKMGSMGPEQDSTLLLSGHPANMPPPPYDPKEAAAKGVAATQMLTAWVGPWGISYAGNITSDSTGIGNWKLEQFSKAMREGKYKGLDASRPIMPPMPVESFKHYTDAELGAMFAYLKSTPPIKNVVPAWQPQAK
ncbi:MAG: diheme cytochrome c-553 [Bacteroidetes bacterium]|nr:MAG: diheme cytochrome c-553 [Bacteroidota bacterium]